MFLCTFWKLYCFHTYLYAIMFSHTIYGWNSDDQQDEFTIIPKRYMHLFH